MPVEHDFPRAVLVRNLKPVRRRHRVRIVVMYRARDVVAKADDPGKTAARRNRRIELQCLEDRPEAIIAHIGNRPCPEFIPAAKSAMRIVRMVIPHLGRPEPQIPVQALGNRRFFGRNDRVLRPNRSVAPIVYLEKFPDRTGVDPRLDPVHIPGRERIIGHHVG